MRVITLEGSPLEMGRAFGEAFRAEIATFYELRVQNAIAQALRYGGRAVSRGDVLEAARQSLPHTRDYDPRGFEELEGIAQGAAMRVEEILATNGLTDLRDVLSWHGPPEGLDGCSALVVQRDLSARDEVLCGQTWDLATDNLPYVLGVHRKPDQGPQSWSLTTVGCLSLIGLNEAGIAAGTTNIRTTDARPGVTYLSLIHKALSSTTLSEAAAAITDAHRAAAHFYYLCDAQGGALVIECSATQAWPQAITRGAYVHTNHCLLPQNVAIQGHAPQASSLARQDRLTALANDATRARHDERALMTFLGDRENGANAICRDDYDGINTNGAVVMAPERGQIWACHGLPTPDNWIDLKRP